MDTCFWLRQPPIDLPSQRRHHNWTVRGATRSSNAGVNLYSVLIVVHKDRELITLLAIRSLRFSKHMVRRSRSSPFGGPSRRKVRVIAVLGSNCNNLGLLKRKPPTWPPDLHQQNGRSPNRPLEPRHTTLMKPKDSRKGAAEQRSNFQPWVLQ